MISFNNDYNNGAHEEVLNHLVETNKEITNVYGFDKYSFSAKEKIRKVFGLNDDSEIYFLNGGTQTNLVLISSVLKEYEGVLSPVTGHINIHEAGAIEYTSHKVIPIDSFEGKIKIDSLKSYLENYYNDGTNEHIVRPGMLYISYPTEYGTLYSKKELEDLYSLCKKYNIYFYIDGARLLYGLSSSDADIDYKDLKNLCDAFYIGGTKEGLLNGEALVFNVKAPDHYLSRIKMHGALSAKGRLIGAQFDALFNNELYKRIGTHTINMAMKLKNIFIEKGYKLFIDSPTNQQFVVLSNDKYESLKDKVEFSIWERVDNDSLACRFVTSFSTKEEDILKLEELL